MGQRSWLASTTFRGRYAAIAPRWTQQYWQKRRVWRGRVLGWYGPIFWPYAYYDTFDYVFWPYAYDLFWPYAYDDLYFGIFGPYTYGPPAYAPDVGPGPDFDREPTGSVCVEPATKLADIPIQRIAETVKPTVEQAAALDELARATARALQVLRAACPTRLPSTPTGRLAAMQSRLEAMLRAVEIIAPAMETFYRTLNDEQRAQFDSLDQEREPADAERQPADLAQICDDRRAGLALPLDRIEDEVRPNDRQRAALDKLVGASARAAEILHTNCPTEAALTAIGRITAMRQRLTAMLDAVIAVRPALEEFYNSLDYEQRARFNVIGTQEG
ncbi:MAG TPA: Spy/CpxP family protein refolding chaperone [Xanthobacteraceae bacterium]|nr:Spy/CpxP family protein refolding chaperone [Xanthobacteraceae bacterium]